MWRSESKSRPNLALMSNALRLIYKSDDTAESKLANDSMPFIVFEGIDGSGKTTLIQNLAGHLKSTGHKLHITREPGGTVLGDEIRNILLRTNGEVPVPRCELLLYEAIRAQHVEKVIRPALAEGIWILCDRFAASSIAFQAGGRKISQSEVEQLNLFATSGLKADLTVLLDLPIEESQRRREKREKDSGVAQDRFEQEKWDFHRTVRESYLQQAKVEPDSWLVLDACLGPQELFNRLLVDMRRRQWLAS